MFTTDKRILAPGLLAASVLLISSLLSGCGGSSSAGSGSQGTTPSTSASPASNFDMALNYSQCMRDNGVPSFPDPQQGGGGISLSPGDVDPNSQAFRDAQEKCRDKLPQGGQLGGGGGNSAPLDSAKVTAWAKCIREHGLPNFPDPEINGGSMAIDFAGSGINPGDTPFQQARQACQDKWPGGALTGTGGGAQ